MYTASVLGNLGNYKSFGDTKIIPRIPLNEFQKIVHSSGSETAIKLFNSISTIIYSDKPEDQLLLGFPGDGHVSGYYSKNILKSDADFVQKILDLNQISVLNTRLFKKSETEYIVAVASAEQLPEKIIEAEGKTIKITFDDFQAEMKKVAAALTKAIPYAANPIQEKMLEAYVESFKTGSIDAHDNSQRFWIKV
ncbi:bifunctional diacylglycerol diphosphate phosphatase/phosphatidate phosphatase [Nowakowskiella sp. JEL0078]|nr:bifunctional diacylglycerol diphosphate phosphatase/phosphatidate phosphatase [Nowakowskiella sp. JEL0078]